MRVISQRKVFPVNDNKRLLLQSALALAAAATFSSGAMAQDKPIKVGVTGGPHAQIFEQVKKVAEKDGLKIQIVELSDYVKPNAALAAGLAATRGGRDSRAQAMGHDLARAGIHGAYEGALQYVSNPALISRTHFARFLVETKVCKDTYEVFRKYLVEGKPGFVEHRWASLADAVRWITQAHGMAVIAHPARYRLTANEEFALFSEFKQHGGQGVEVVTGSHSVAEYAEYADMAREFGLAASRGSDFHSPDESHTELGSLPPLPRGVTPVWELLAERIQRAA